jgi:hypothetical protein
MHRAESRLLGLAMSDRHDAELAVASLRMAAGLFAGACRSLGVVQSMGRVGSALDSAAAESFFSTLEHELLSRRQFATREEARRVVAGWIDRFYNRIRRHSTTECGHPSSTSLPPPLERRQHDQPSTIPGKAHRRSQFGRSPGRSGDVRAGQLNRGRPLTAGARWRPDRDIVTGPYLAHVTPA